jgi:hypothetical protein
MHLLRRVTGDANQRVLVTDFNEFAGIALGIFLALTLHPDANRRSIGELGLRAPSTCRRQLRAAMAFHSAGPVCVLVIP